MGFSTRVMKTKLTLTIDDDVIAAAKAYAKQSGKSLSALVESYLNDVTHLRKNKNEGSVAAESEVAYEKSFIPKELQEIAGIIELPEDFDYKEFIREERYKDYMYGKDRKGTN